MTYTQNTPLLFNNEDIIAVLDREDALIAKNVSEKIIIINSFMSFDQFMTLLFIATCTFINTYLI
jgi:hypothetical protein